MSRLIHTEATATIDSFRGSSPAVNEPDDLTGWVDCAGGLWVRVDDCPGRYGTWYPRRGGPGFNDDRETGDIGTGIPWAWLVDYAPLTAASPEATTETIEMVRTEWAR